MYTPPPPQFLPPRRDAGNARNQHLAARAGSPGGGGAQVQSAGVAVACGTDADLPTVTGLR